MPRPPAILAPSSADWSGPSLYVPAQLPDLSPTQAEGRLSGRERSLFFGLVAVVVTVAFPGKFLFYISPLLLLAVSMTSVPVVSLPRVLLLCGGVFGLSLVSILIDLAGGAQVNFPGLLFAVVTYSPFVLLLTPALSFRPERPLMVAVVRLCAVFLLIQGVLSVAQFSATGDGDYVSGSYGLFDAVSGSKTISQVNLTFTLFCMVVFVLPYARAVPWTATAIIFGIVTCAIAQSGHQTIFFLLALPAAVLTTARVRRAAPALGVAALTIALLVAFYPETSFVAREWLRKVVLADDSLKRAVVESGLDRLAESWKNMLLGIGLGQYTSRASLFAAGFQSSVQLPAALTGASGYFTIDVLPLILRYDHVGETSAIAKPYFSAISLIVEVGPPLTAALLWLAAREFCALSRIGRRGSGEEEGAARYCKFFIIFLALNCLVENYLELMQAVAIPMALYAIARARLRTIATELARVGA
jgi:hypothetical protein